MTTHYDGRVLTLAQALEEATGLERDLDAANRLWNEMHEHVSRGREDLAAYKSMLFDAVKDRMTAKDNTQIVATQGTSA